MRCARARARARRPARVQACPSRALKSRAVSTRRALRSAQQLRALHAVSFVKHVIHEAYESRSIAAHCALLDVSAACDVVAREEHVTASSMRALYEQCRFSHTPPTTTLRRILLSRRMEVEGQDPSRTVKSKKG